MKLLYIQWKIKVIVKKLTILIINANGKHIGTTPVEKECAWKKKHYLWKKKNMNIWLSKNWFVALTKKRRPKKTILYISALY